MSPDPSQGLTEPELPPVAFDLSLCLEVLGRIPDDRCEAILTKLAERTQRAILFSAPEPGQPGHWNINRRGIGDWMRRWKDLGWSPHLHDTLAVRSLSSLAWFRRNLIVLNRSGEVVDPVPAEMLQLIARKKFHWYDVSPGVRSELALDRHSMATQGCDANVQP